MNTTHAPTTTTSGPLSQPRSHRGRRRLIWLAIFAATIALFYTEENWRGRRDWENCKRELEAKGSKMDWSNYIPPPVPEDQNIFGVPEMQKWFTGRGPTEFSKKLDLIGTDIATNSARMIVARLTIGLPGTTPPAGSIVLSWADTNNAKAQTALLIRQALGPLAMDPSGFDLMANKPEDVRPAQIFLQCQTAPTKTNLLQLLPNFVAPRIVTMYGVAIDSEKLKLESTGGNSYQVTMFTPIRAADYVEWMKKVGPDLAVVRQALQRPYSRMEGDYSYPPFIPIPNFVTIRAVSQRLAALAKCYMLLGQPEKALDQLTLIHQLCVMLEARPSGKPMTLVEAMINVAVTGLYAETIQDGMRLQVWREPQLTALQEQLKEINLQPYVRSGFDRDQAGMCATVEMTPLAEMGNLFRMGDLISSGKPFPHPKFSFPFSLIPRGWVYQNMVFGANLYQVFKDDNIPSPDRLVGPHKANAFPDTLDRELAHRSPFKILAAIAIPNFTRAIQTYAHVQTTANQGQIVCALERYRLARGEYPATLEELTPQFIEKIPLDPIGGQPPHYHRTTDGKFLLYSIGWSEKDHGGQIGYIPANASDWIWGED